MKNKFFKDLEELRSKVLLSRACLDDKIYDSMKILDTANLEIHKGEYRFWGKVLKHLDAIENDAKLLGGEKNEQN